MKSINARRKRREANILCKNNRKTCRYECFISERNFIVSSAQDEMKKSKKYSKYLHAIKERSQNS